jgi:hypothetical protein
MQGGSLLRKRGSWFREKNTGRGNSIPVARVTRVFVLGQELVSDQLLDRQGFDVVTDDLRVPFAVAPGAVKGHYPTVWPRRKEVRAIAAGKQRAVPAAPDVRAVDDVIRQHAMPPVPKKGKQ